MEEGMVVITLRVMIGDVPSPPFR